MVSHVTSFVRQVVFFGAILASFSMFVASFSSHLAMLFVFAGLVPFTGVSMIYAPGFVNIADATSAENRPLSYAVAEAGCTIGGMAMPILFEWLRQVNLGAYLLHLENFLKRKKTKKKK